MVTDLITSGVEDKDWKGIYPKLTGRILTVGFELEGGGDHRTIEQTLRQALVRLEEDFGMTGDSHWGQVDLVASKTIIQGNLRYL